MDSTDRKLRVFLSYAKEDFQSVHEIYRRLKNEGWIEPWQDKTELLPGEHWTAAIKKAIDVADAVIIFLSDNSISKEGFVHYEMNYAWDRSLQKPPGTIYRIPIRLDDCEVPEDLYDLDTRQWVDYFDEKKDETYEKLLKSLKVRLEQKERLEAKEHARAEKLAKKQADEKTRIEAEERTRKEKAQRERKEAKEKETKEKTRSVGLEHARPVAKENVRLQKKSKVSVGTRRKSKSDSKDRKTMLKSRLEQIENELETRYALTAHESKMTVVYLENNDPSHYSHDKLLDRQKDFFDQTRKISHLEKERTKILDDLQKMDS